MLKIHLTQQNVLFVLVRREAHLNFKIQKATINILYTTKCIAP